MKFNHLILAAALTFLVACGGGGGGSGDSQTPPDMQVLPEQPQEPEMGMPGMTGSNTYSQVSVSLAETTGNPTSARLLSYLQSSISGGPWKAGPDYTYSGYPGLARFTMAPTVRIAQGTLDHTRALIHHAVALINRELPWQWHLQIGSDAPPLAAIDSIPNNQIFIDFAPFSDWNTSRLGRPGARGRAQLDIRREYDFAQRRLENKVLNSAHVWMVPETEFRHELHLMSVLVHELIHAVGLHGHVDASEFPDSLMRDISLLFIRQGRIPEIDGAALRAIYTRYNTGTEPEELTVTSLGPWETTQTNLTGSIGVVSFGVTHRNDVGVPWTSGPEPSTALGNNRTTMGTATWNGGLVGFTPNKQSVGGNAEISVNMGTLAGRADFTALQSWSVGQPPGALGTGTTWGDGDLRYTISVSGNYLQSTGGDEGTVAGNFYGSNHEGVAGSLERSDLTAAFGASR